MAYLLFPGRHVANTKFQESYLRRLLYPVPGTPPVAFVDNECKIKGTLDTIVFAITAANQQDSRFNPVPFTERAIGVDRFRHSLTEILPFSVNYRIVGIPHIDHSHRFARQIVEEIAA
ncbi:MAG: hypothetical protein Q7R96_02105, partial [Nanoarchaeota archaeon]|nr:hypothetical protein [Nanoarchaeota archaeon]